MNTLRLVVAFVIILIVAVLVSANLGTSHSATLTVLGKDFEVSVGVLMLGAWVFGVFSYLVFALLGEIRLRTRLARQKHENEQLMHELNDLRNLPLAGDEPAEPAGDKPKERS